MIINRTYRTWYQNYYYITDGITNRSSGNSNSSSSSSSSSEEYSTSSSSSSSGWGAGTNNILWYSAARNGDVSATGTITDYSASLNDGTLVANAYMEGDGANKGIVLDGTGDEVTVGSLDLSGSAITFSAWIYAVAWEGSSPFISHVSGIEDTGSAYIRFGDALLANNKLQFVLNIGGEEKLDGVSTLNTDAWYHVAATYDGNEMIMYINGNFENSRDDISGNFSASGNFMVGDSFGSHGREFHGILDEVMVWQRCLSSSEISDLYNNGYAK